MSEQNSVIDKKADIQATIYNEAKTTWNQSEIQENNYPSTAVTTNKISAENITAGSWKGTFNFDIALTYIPEDTSSGNIETN